MFGEQRVAVVVPAFNTGARVRRVVETIPRWVDDVVVVDDASTDDTAAVLAGFEDRRLVVVRHDENLGVGAAIATGYGRAMALGAAVVAVMAGDGQMDPSDLEALVAPVARGEADYAKGNRLRHPACFGVMPPSRWVGNIVLSAMTRAATGLSHVGDSQCGYTAISRRVLTALALDRLWRRYGYPNHLLGALAARGYRVKDVTVRPVYAGERSGVRVRDALVTVPRIIATIAWTRVTDAVEVPVKLRGNTRVSMDVWREQEVAR